MDYVLREFGTATDWNFDNTYSALTATSDAILAFPTPSTLSLHVSSLSTSNFATAYTLSTLGQIDGSISYLYTTFPLNHLSSLSQEIPLKSLVHGYRDIKLPVKLDSDDLNDGRLVRNGRKPTLLHATLALPPPSNLTGLYARRLDPRTLLAISLDSKAVATPATSGPPPATVLAHLQRDTGIYSIEALASTDSALLGARGLWNFGLRPSLEEADELAGAFGIGNLGGIPSLPIPPAMIDKLSLYHQRLSAKPSLLSAGAEFYYSPVSHVIGLSTGLRFTTLGSRTAPSLEVKEESSSFFASKPLAGTSAALSSVLAPSNVSHSSFPYTMTLTLAPLTGSLSSTYSVSPTANLALSSRFDFNVYSWESQYVVGAEIWRRHKRRSSKQVLNAQGHLVDEDPTAWVRRSTENWFTPAEKALKEKRIEREEENVVNIRIDDGWNVKALWTGRVKALLVSAGLSVGPVPTGFGGLRSRPTLNLVDEEGRRKRWTGSVGVSIAYST